MAKWKILAEDNGDLFPVYFLYEAMNEQMHSILGVRVNNGMHHGANQEWEFIFDPENWELVGSVAYKKLKTDKEFLQIIRDKIINGCRFMIEASEKAHKADLAKLNNKELWDLFQGYRQKNKNMYVWGMVPSFIEFGIPRVSNEIREILKRKLNGDEKLVSDYFVTLTTSDEDTTIKQEEKSLLSTAKEIVRNPEAKELFKKSVEEIKKELCKFKEIDEKIDEHTEEYGSTGYVYLGPAWTKEHYIQQLKSLIEKRIDPEKKLSAEEKKNEIISKKKKAIINELQFTEDEIHLINSAAEFGFLKLFRKDMLYKSYYHFHRWLEEVCSRFDLTVKQLRYVLPEEIEEMLLKGKVIDKKILDERAEFYCFVLQDKKLRLLQGKEAKEFYDKHVEKVDASNVNELKGECACQGKVVGVIKLVRTVEDMQKMQKGDILISPATNPNLVPAMEKAGAIITDAGGITCHAAIVSRELGIPCVIGTKIVTKAFKDGDNVEVDATKGIVRRVK